MAEAPNIRPLPNADALVLAVYQVHEESNEAWRRRCDGERADLQRLAEWMARNNQPATPSGGA